MPSRRTYRLPIVEVHIETQRITRTILENDPGHVTIGREHFITRLQILHRRPSVRRGNRGGHMQRFASPRTPAEGNGHLRLDGFREKIQHIKGH